MDSPWQRLPFTFPVALALTAALLLAFLRVVSLGTSSVAAQPVLDARFVELASPGAPESPAAPKAAADVATPSPPKTVAPTPRPKPTTVRRPAAPTPTSAAPAAAGEAAEAAAAAQTSATQSGAHSEPGGSLGGSMSARALYRPLPEVPERLRHRDAELLAVARFQVAADGSAQVELIEPTSEPTLNQSLLATLRTWRFFPALQDGRPVVSTIDIRIPISVK